MATLVLFHAHPDDESIVTGGTMAAAAGRGHRIVLVVATRGELGVATGGGSPESLGQLRETETLRAAEILGVSRVEFLGYRDSGEADDVTDSDPNCFARAEVDQAASRLAAILREESAAALTIYDPIGVTAHPDHVHVHHVGVRAAELATLPDLGVYQATLAESQIERLAALVATSGRGPDDPSRPPQLTGTPDADITTSVDVRSWIDRKRMAIAAHASQIPAEHGLLTMPAEAFGEIWGREHYLAWPDQQASTGLLEGLS